MTRRVWYLLAFAGAIVFLATMFADVIPPSSVTIGRMSGLCRRIERYALIHGQLPPDVASIPLEEGDTLEDAWHHRLRYELDSSDAFTFTSLGADGKAGGSGQAEDIVSKYRLVKGEVVETWHSWMPRRPTTQQGDH